MCLIKKIFAIIFLFNSILVFGNDTIPQKDTTGYADFLKRLRELRESYEKRIEKESKKALPVYYINFNTGTNFSKIFPINHVHYLNAVAKNKPGFYIGTGISKKLNNSFIINSCINNSYIINY